MKKWLKTLEHELKATLTKPGAQLTRGQRTIQLSLDLWLAGLQDLMQQESTVWDVYSHRRAVLHNGGLSRFEVSTVHDQHKVESSREWFLQEKQSPRYRVHYLRFKSRTSGQLEGVSDLPTRCK